jgi:uncharacterized protein (TIGR02231 family)
MRTATRHLPLVSAILLGSLSLAAVPPRSVIEEIRLYREGGEALRKVVLEGFDAAGPIIVEGLPGNTDPNDLRVRVAEGAGLRLGAIRFERMEGHELQRGPELVAAEAERDRLVQALEDLNGRIESADRRTRLFADLREAYLKGIEESPEAELSEKVLGAFEQEQAALREKRDLERELKGSIEDLERQKAGAEKRLRDLRRQAGALNGRLVIEAAGTAPGPVVLEIRTRFGDAGWEPHYRFNAEPAAGAMELDYQARLRNQTGETWEAARITLLTGRPGWRTEAPELPPVYLHKPQPPAPAMARGKEVAMMAIQDSPAAAPLAEAQAERLTTQFELTLPAPVTVDGFEPGKTVELAVRRLEAAFWSTVTPAIAEQAFLHGEARIELDWPLLPGPAVLLVDGAVSGRRHIGFINPGEPLELGFGENPAIEVTRKVLEVMDRDSGLLSKARNYQRHYEVVAHNRMPVAHTLRVRSRFPVSRDQQIEVKRLEPADAEVDPETGRFEWERRLAPGGEAVFTTRFEVVAPRDWELPGNF